MVAPSSSSSSSSFSSSADADADVVGPLAVPALDWLFALRVLLLEREALDAVHSQGFGALRRAYAAAAQRPALACSLLAPALARAVVYRSPRRSAALSSALVAAALPQCLARVQELAAVRAAGAAPGGSGSGSGLPLYCLAEHPGAGREIVLLLGVVSAAREQLCSGAEGLSQGGASSSLGSAGAGAEAEAEAEAGAEEEAEEGEEAEAMAGEASAGGAQDPALAALLRALAAVSAWLLALDAQLQRHTALQSSGEHAAALAGRSSSSSSSSLDLWAPVQAADAIGAAGVRGQLHGLVGSLLYHAVERYGRACSAGTRRRLAALVSGLLAFAMAEVTQGARLLCASAEGMLVPLLLQHTPGSGPRNPPIAAAGMTAAAPQITEGRR
jgi:hypothetical protein